MGELPACRSIHGVCPFPIQRLADFGGTDRNICFHPFRFIPIGVFDVERGQAAQTGKYRRAIFNVAGCISVGTFLCGTCSTGRGLPALRFPMPLLWVRSRGFEREPKICRADRCIFRSASSLWLPAIYRVLFRLGRRKSEQSGRLCGIPRRRIAVLPDMGGSRQTGKVLKTVCSTLVLSAICLSGSRAGIISGGFILGVFLWKTVAMSAEWRRVIGSTSIIMGAVVGCILFSWKQDSAMGRILIWKISGGMVVEAPVWGRGAGSFQADYMTCQADFFKANPDSKYVQVAGNVFHPFNEFLLLSIEFGLVGLLLVSLILFPVVRNICISGFNPFSTCIAAIALFSCFSYPVHYAYVCIVLAFCLGNVQLKPLFWLKIRRIGLFVLGGLSAMILFFCLAKDVEYEYQWNRIREGTLSGKAPELMEQYRLLYQKWNYNPRFLYHYGVTLNYIGLHRSSNDILAQCSEVYNSYDLQMLMGNNYYAEGKWDLALSHYAKASQMCPNRFRPLYMQIMVYDHRQEYDSAAQLARELLVKPVKIPSDEIRQMQSEARRYTRNLNRD